MGSIGPLEWPAGEENMAGLCCGCMDEKQDCNRPAIFCHLSVLGPMEHDNFLVFFRGYVHIFVGVLQGLARTSRASSEELHLS